MCSCCLQYRLPNYISRRESSQKKLQFTEKLPNLGYNGFRESAEGTSRQRGKELKWNTSSRPLVRLINLPALCSSLAIMIAVLPASLYCFKAMYSRNRYFASYNKQGVSIGYNKTGRSL